MTTLTDPVPIESLARTSVLPAARSDPRRKTVSDSPAPKSERP